MGSGLDIRRKRLKVLVDVWGQIIDRGNMTREEVIELLKKEYERNGVEPFRGVAKPQDIYEKDMITLYLVAIYGLNIQSEYSEIIDKIFSLEKSLEQACELLYSEDNPDVAREKIIKIFNKNPDSALLSKIFRVEILKHYFGFIGEDRMSKILRNMLKAFPEEEATVRRLSKFYIAYKVGEAILKGEIKDWTSKEAYKQAIAVELGGIRGIPDDEYIAKILSTIFGAKKEIYSSILRISRGEIAKRGHS